jgi:hypothetical protein
MLWDQFRSPLHNAGCCCGKIIQDTDSWVIVDICSSFAASSFLYVTFHRVACGSSLNKMSPLPAACAWYETSLSGVKRVVQWTCTTILECCSRSSPWCWGCNEPEKLPRLQHDAWSLMSHIRHMLLKSNDKNINIFLETFSNALIIFTEIGTYINKMYKTSYKQYVAYSKISTNIICYMVEALCYKSEGCGSDSR